MKNKMKLGLSGLALITTLSSCASIEPHASIDLGYVPSRTDDRIVENQFKAELDCNLELKVSEDISAILGGTARTYISKDVSIFFNPTRQEYDAYAKLLFGDDFEIYAFHNCSHPVNDSPEQEWVVNKDGNFYILNHDDITEFGVKYKW